MSLHVPPPTHACTPAQPCQKVTSTQNPSFPRPQIVQCCSIWSWRGLSLDGQLGGPWPPCWWVAWASWPSSPRRTSYSCWLHSSSDRVLGGKKQTPLPATPWMPVILVADRVQGLPPPQRAPTSQPVRVLPTCKRRSRARLVLVGAELCPKPGTDEVLRAGNANWGKGGLGPGQVVGARGPPVMKWGVEHADDARKGAATHGGIGHGPSNEGPDLDLGSREE